MEGHLCFLRDFENIELSLLCLAQPINEDILNWSFSVGKLLINLYIYIYTFSSGITFV